MRIERVELGSALLQECFDLRAEVFVVEQGVPVELELDALDADPATQHLAAITGLDGTEHVVGTVRWVIEPAGFEGTQPSLGPAAHLQRLAVAQQARGNGLGAALVAAVEADAAERGHRVVYLAAQSQAVPFYVRLGYTQHGDVFDDAGIPHHHMTKSLNP
jgi:predicted GNAT family N-acyltransferase